MAPVSAGAFLLEVGKVPGVPKVQEVPEGRLIVGLL